MARETRRQRRDARRAGADQGGGVNRPPRLRTAEAGGPGDGGPSFDAAPAPILGGRSGGVPGVGFVRESWAELKKVEWPNRSQVVQGTVVVLIACAIVGVFLYGADEAIRPFVRDVLLGQ